MADIRINQLPLGGGPVATDFMPLDNGSTRKATIQNIVEIGRPAASQVEAETGTNPTKVITPLTAKQSIASEVGVSLQAYDPGLTSIAGLITSANQMIYTTGADAYATTSLTPFGRSILDDADDVAVRATINLGNASTLNVGTTAGTVAAGDDSRIVNAVPNSRTLTAGTGLTGGGDLSADRTIALNAASITSLANADTSVQPNSLAAMKNMSVFAGRSVVVTDQGREGVYIWTLGDFTAAATDDPAQNIIVPSNLIPITTGAWVSSTGRHQVGMWSDIHPGTPFARFGGRLFVGGGVLNDGKFTPVKTDWLNTAIQAVRPGFATTQNSQMIVLSDVGLIGGIFGSRTSDNPSAGSQGSIGAMFVSLNDNTNNQSSYAIYGEAIRYAGAGTTHFLEADVANRGANVTIGPYDMFTDGLTSVLWAAGGGGVPAANSTSVAIGIVENGAKFIKGIVFHKNALLGTDGVTGSGTAVEMAKGHVIQQVYAANSPGSSLFFDVSNVAAGQSLQFTDLGLRFVNPAGKDLLAVGIGLTFVNGLKVTPGAAGSPVTIQPMGDDATINLNIGPKGAAGRINLVNPIVTGASGAQIGFITIQLSGGDAKIPVYNP